MVVQKIFNFWLKNLELGLQQSNLVLTQNSMVVLF